MYVPYELLEQVKKQVLTEFKGKIISFEWFHEEEYTSILVQIGEIALQIPLDNRIHEIAYTIIGHPDSSEYIVPISVSATESVEATDGLFNLAYHGAGSNSFFVHYYAPERDPLRPFKVSVHYKKMFEAMRTIHLDSPAQLWKRLVRPIDETYAKHYKIHSFSKELLAEELRDFLLKHLDFIKHIAQVTNKPLQIIEPVPILAESNGQSGQRVRTKKAHQAREMALAIAAA
ncbi:MAG: hypothetical protein ACPGWR_13455 [Ardenticatenaceae bacterium]